MNPPGRVPWVWVVASHRELQSEHHQPQRYTLVDEVAQRTLRNLGLQPVCFPRVPAGRLPAMLAVVQGVFMGGSATNVDPRHYGEEPADPQAPLDHEREAVALPLVRLCLDQRVPIMGVCRGSHELNVALGGSLHQDLRALGRGVTHWESDDESLDAQYAPRHAVRLLPGGALERLVGVRDMRVSSLHSQGARTLGPGLVAEAQADDGLVEAFRWHAADRYAWGFQFHPEWDHRAFAPYGRIMAAFVAACWQRLADAG